MTGAATIPGLPEGTLHPSRRFEWERTVRRIRLGFYEGKTKDPRRWVRHATVQHVAMVLATYADQDGTRVKPSVARVALVCEIDERTVRACIGRLRSLGLLRLVQPHRAPGRNGGPGRSAEYRMTTSEDLMLRAAYLDPDEQKLTVPNGVDVAPERKSREKKAALPVDNGGSGPVDNSRSAEERHEGSPGHSDLHEGSPADSS